MKREKLGPKAWKTKDACSGREELSLEGQIGRPKGAGKGITQRANKARSKGVEAAVADPKWRPSCRDRTLISRDEGEPPQEVQDKIVPVGILLEAAT